MKALASDITLTDNYLFTIHSYFLLQIRGFSSAGRAPALQAGGQRFDPANLHQERGNGGAGSKTDKTRANSSAG